jgi:hypothetical protein
VVRATRESLIAHPLNKETSAVRVVRAGIKVSLQLITKSIKMLSYANHLNLCSCICNFNSKGV